MASPALQNSKDIPTQKPHADSRMVRSDSKDESRTDGTEGFSPQYSGNGISGQTNTSSFDTQAGEPGRATRVKGGGPIE